MARKTSVHITEKFPHGVCATKKGESVLVHQIWQSTGQIAQWAWRIPFREEIVKCVWLLKNI